MLGGSARHWHGVIAALGPAYTHCPVDLPGFGDAVPGAADVAGMAQAVVRALPPGRFVVVGHSMGAKVAAVLAHRAETGDPALADLAGVVTLAGSPPGPEPMDEARREAMLEWAAGGPIGRAAARSFVEQNTARRLRGDAREVALADVRRCDPAAWTAWLDSGANEDWSGRVGVLQTPALIVAGTEDGDLGPAAQARLMAPHFAHATTATVAGAAHMLPLEQPAAVAALLSSFLSRLTVPAAYVALIDSPRVSAATRAALLTRLEPPAPGPLTATERATLAAVLKQLIPGSGEIGLAARVEAGLATGDGWRPAVLPDDLTAYRTGLAALAHFPALDPDKQGRLLAQLFTMPDDPDPTPALTAAPVQREAAAPGMVRTLHRIAPEWAGWTTVQMRAWMDDLRDAAVRAWVAHPATLASLHYSGIAYAGDGAFKPGFADPGLGGREAWEP